MRKFILACAFLFGMTLAHASVFDVYQTSFTQSGDNFKVIYSSPVVLYSVCIASSGVTGSASAALTVFNSTATNSIFMSTVTIIDTSRTQTGCYPYNVYLSSGLTYTNAGTTPAKINIQYNGFSH